MGLIKKLFGTPPEHTEEKEKKEVVKTPEFDITQYAKKLGVSAGVILGGVIAGLKALEVEEVTDPAVLVGALAVVAAAFLGMSFVMAMDLAARAYLSGEGSAAKEDDDAGADEGEAPNGEMVSAPPGTQVWLEGDSDPHPVLAMSGDGEKVSSYLVAKGSTIERVAEGKPVKAIDGTAEWYGADKIRAIRAAKWP